MPYYFNGVDLSSVGLMVNKCNPAPCSQMEYETINIPGREQTIRSDKKSRSNISIVAECTVIEPDKLREIFALFQGQGKFIHRDEPDKFYYASPKVISPQNVILYMNKMTINFDCQPFAYAVRNDPLVYTEKEFCLTNNGTYYCQPKYKLYGTGDISLIVNGQELVVKDVKEYAVADSEKLLCYKNNTIIRSKGYIPFLNTGNNSIKTNAKQIEITKNERWL